MSRALPSATALAERTADELDPRRWLVLAVCLSALFMTLLDATIVNVALPSIGTTLHADAARPRRLPVVERGPARRRGHPLIDTRLFRVHSYVDGLGLALLYFAGFTGTSLVLSLFLQFGMGFAPLQSGLTASSLALGLAIGGPIAGRLINRNGRFVLAVALGTFAVGIASAAATVRLTAGSISGAALAWLLAPSLFVASLGGVSVITPNQALSLREVDMAGGSTAGGMLQTAQRSAWPSGARVRPRETPGRGSVLTAAIYPEWA